MVVCADAVGVVATGVSHPVVDSNNIDIATATTKDSFDMAYGLSNLFGK
jgi:hypothetical protein